MGSRIVPYDLSFLTMYILRGSNPILPARERRREGGTENPVFGVKNGHF